MKNTLLPDEYLQSAMDYETKTAAKGGWWTVGLAQIPTLLWAGLCWLEWQVRLGALPQLPPTQGEGIVFFAVCIGIFEAAYCVFTLGYGLASVPLAVILVFVLAG